MTESAPTTAANYSRGQPLLLVFSDPDCGPCQQLMPELEWFHRATPEVRVVVVTRGERGANREKAAQQRLTFAIGLQRSWEVSRAYAMFATPVAYWVDAEEIVAADVAVGLEPIRELMTRLEANISGDAATSREAAR